MFVAVGHGGLLQQRSMAGAIVSGGWEARRGQGEAPSLGLTLYSLPSPRRSARPLSLFWSSVFLKLYVVFKNNSQNLAKLSGRATAYPGTLYSCTRVRAVGRKALRKEPKGPAASR